MRITADRDVCDGHGMCEAMAHEFFELDDDGLVLVLDEAPGDEHRELVDSAVRSCPVSALRLEA
ncbi:MULTISPECIES: ferredoxin [unclassified Pseudonocardia]|jgi:ferredoxin|uniref:ferredoxin n=1 Tax=unclassified Pseudonocardia TaxID=2619320 RepID=UPI00095CC982|nr:MULTISPECIES: ferredoxin [unclassified Pseudonocardia]MBN9101074.1 ferredoxin [Pseudonocardia sp.]OJY41432.1 MAG: ferredoxin [Pseudonocardia sp. 73-21]